MLFDVKVLYNGEEQVWQWGTKSCSVTDNHGIRRNPKTQGWRPAQGFSREEADIRGLSIFLGYNCNLNCKYCYQKPYREGYDGAVTSPSQIPEFIERLKEMAFTQMRNISFWGGEPLVFWKTIQPLTLELEKLYPEVRFSIVTNGTLLTNDMVDFFAEHNFSVNVSCDGFPDDRGYDLLLLKGPELRYLMDKLGDQAIFQACVSRGNEDVAPALARFKKMLGDDVRVSFSHPVRATDANDPSAELVIEDWRKFADSLYKTRRENPENWVMTGISDLNRFIRGRSSLADIVRFCGPSSGATVPLDLKGNTYSCHAGPMKPTGVLEKFRERDFSEFLSEGIVKAHCGECPLYIACKAGCPMTTKEGLELSCAGRYGLAFAMFKVAWKDLFDVEVVDITPHIKESK